MTGYIIKETDKAILFMKKKKGVNRTKWYPKSWISEIIRGESSGDWPKPDKIYLKSAEQQKLW